MSQEQKELLYIFLHIPKTGGTTFSGHLFKNFVWNEELIHIGPWGDHYNHKNRQKSFFKRTKTQRSKAKVLAGHNTYWGIHQLIPNKKSRYVTFLRDPAERLVSIFNFVKSRKEIDPTIEFKEWYESYRRNELTLWFSKRHKGVTPWATNKIECGNEDDYILAKQIIEDCFYVGITRHLDDDMSKLSDILKIPHNWKSYRIAGNPTSSIDELNHPGKHEILKIFYTLDDVMNLQIRRENPLDYKLYDFALKKNEQFRTTNS